MPSSLDITGGALTYTGAMGETNNLTVSVANSNLTFSDTGATIMLTPGAQLAGWTSSGPNTVTGPESSITSGMQINLSGSTTVVTIASLGSTAEDTTISYQGFGMSTNAVTVGSGGSAQGVHATVSVQGPANPFASTSLTVNDSADTTARTATLGSTLLSGLTPDSISYTSISSLTVDGGSGGNKFTVTGTPAATTLNSGTGADTVTIDATAAAGALTVNGQSSTDTVTVGDAGSVQAINGTVDITNAAGSTALTVDDSADLSSQTATIDASSVTGLASAAIDYSGLSGLTIKGGSAGNTFTVAGTLVPTTLNSGTGPDTVTVDATGASAALTLNGQGGADQVTIGNGGTVQQIDGTVTITNAGGFTALTVDDSADTTGQTATVGASALTGLAPAAINYSNLASLKVSGGSGGNTFTISGTAVPTTLKSGTGADTVTIDATGAAGSLTVNGQSGLDTVTVGGAGTVQSINGTVTLSSPSGFINLMVDDHNDSTPKAPTVGATGLTGLAPASINYSNLMSLTVDGGSGGNQFTVTSTPAATVLNAGTGADSVFVQTTSALLTINGQNGADAVDISNGGGVQGIAGAVTVTNASGSTALVVDDSTDNPGRTATVGATTITGLAPATITYSGLGSLTVDGGTGTNTFSVTGTPAATTLNGGTGNDTVTIGNNHTLQGITAGVAVTSASGTMALTVDDGADATGRSAVLGASVLTGLPGGTYSYSGLSALTVDGGGGNNTFTVSGTPASTTLNSGTGSDAVVILATSAALTVNGQKGSDTVMIGSLGSVQGINAPVTIGNAAGSTALIVDDSADPTGRGTAQSPVNLAAGSLTGLAPATVSYSNLGSLIVKGGSGGNVFSVAGTPASTTLNSGTGKDTVIVQATTAALMVNGQSGSDTVTVGSGGSVQNIAGAVTVTNASGSTALTVDDSADTTGRGTSASPITLGASALSNLAPAAITYGGLSSLTVNGGSGGNDFSVTGTPATTTLNSGTGNDTVVVQATSFALTVNGQNGTDTVTVGNSTNGVQSINGSVTVGNQQGTTALTVDDSADTTPQGNAGVPVNFGNGAIIGLAPAPIAYSGLSSFTIDGGSGGNAFAVNGTPAATTLNSGTGTDLVFIRDTANPLTVNGQKGTDTVTIGDNQSVQGIQGPVTITNAAGSTGLVVDDSKDSQGRGTATSPVVIGATSLTNLAPATISYSGLRFLTVDAGSGGNIISVTGTPAGTTLNAGTGKNTVLVQATSQPLTINGQGGTDTINVQAAGAALTIDGQGGTDTVTLGSTGTVQNIAGPVAVSNSGGTTALTVDDSADPTGQTATLSVSALDGLAPGQQISYVAPDVISLLVKGGPGGNTFIVSGTSTPTTLDSGHGDDVVTVQTTEAAGPLTIDGQDGRDTVTISNNHSVQNIFGTVTVQNTRGLTDLIADDSADSTGRVVTFPAVLSTPFTQIAGLAPTAIDFITSQLNSLTVDFGNGNDIINVSGISNLNNGLLDGGGGVNQLASTNNMDFQLSDTGFTRSSGGVVDARFALKHFQQALLTGGPGDNYLNAAGFSGSVALDGGGAGDDTLIGGSGTNSLVGGAGDDSLVAGSGNSTLLGNGGDDTLIAGSGNDSLDGGTGDNLLTGGSGSSTLVGGPGDDTLIAGSGPATLMGGAGNDSLVGGSGSTIMMGGPGNNIVTGGSGTSTVLEQQDDNFTLTNSLLTGTGATPFTDILVNVRSANLTDTNATGVARTLIATAFSGNVTLTGGTGNDTLMGGLGTSVLSGGLGTNKLVGGKGINTVSENQAASFALTGTKLTAAGVLLTDTLTGIQQGQLADPSSDVAGRILNASAFKGKVTLTGGGGPDTLIGSLGNDSIDGGTGGSILQASGAVNFNFTTATTLTGLGTYTLNSDLHNVRLTITSGNHFINAALYGGNATLQGGSGNDTLIAGTGTDSLNGGGGNNVLLGGGGSDTLVGGGSGRNLLIGGTGTDVLTGGTNDDILIAGTTNFDSQTRAGNFAAVNAIMAEWTSTDSYTVRVARLMGTQSGGKNGATQLTTATVFSSFDTTVQPDTLTGGLGSDWFLCKAGTLDTVTDRQTGIETRTDV